MRHKEEHHLVQDRPEKKQQNVTEVQHHMEADLSQCSQASEGKNVLALAKKKALHLQQDEEEKLKLCTELQKKTCTSEDTVQYLQLQLRSYQHSIQSVRDDLHRLEDSVQSLKGKEERDHLPKQKLLNAQESTKFMQKGLDVSKDLSHTLQQQLGTTDQNCTCREMLMACEAWVKETPRENPCEVMSCEEGIENIKKDLRERLNNRLQSTKTDLQGKLKMSVQENLDHLKRRMEKAKAKSKAEIEQLQHKFDKAKEKVREMEGKLHTQSKWTI